ncbi:tannase/feruloyl esterase family alpha/beta hydrolase [Pseudorhodoferax sp.]|uniref:tannase/feruloyl esterase family alpha/beta hydrolase n=1 Tax=Pseudorhodoferax sp. TaxID=1993553 RepID=UPI002DD65C69|nr:tannase/feruloyl esterase family alpha/beta hydrolase [Pseudorhodoferax sp.]
MERRIYPAMAALLAALAGCGGSGGDDAGESPAPLDAAAACQALASFSVPASGIGLPTRGASISSATLVPGTDALPEHCRVNGSIASVDFTAASINFSAALPTNWNRKLMHHGGGGWDGTVVNPTIRGGGQHSGPTSLQRGYAVFGSDSGHNDPTGVNASFALNAEQLQNFAGDQLKKTRDAVMALVLKRYGTAPTKTYFQGGSEGGRESITAILQYPNDYDGVITLYPVYNWFSSFYKWHMIGRAMRANNGAGHLSPAKLGTLRAAELAACDAQDGVADGLISNVKACSFDPQVLLCPGGVDQGDSCLSQAQLATVQLMNSSATLPYPLANGNTYVPRYYAGTEWINQPGTSQLGLSPTYTNGLDRAGLGIIPLFGDSLVRYVIRQDAGTDTMGFDPMQPGSALARVQQASAMLDKTSTDISAFLARGGKWLMAHGLADELPLADGTEALYRQLVARYGQGPLDAGLRFYTIPGYGHGHGAFMATGGMPTLDALEAWVEQGVAPGNLVVTDTNPGANRTRPMCVFPGWPKYSGSGDVNAAASYTCVTD